MSSTQHGKTELIGFGTNYNLNMGPAKPTTLNHDEEDHVSCYEMSGSPWEREGDELVQVQTTASSTFFLTKGGKIYTCGTLHGNVRVSLTRTIVQLPLKCVEVSAGRHFGLARMEGGLAVCSWGAGHFGQLGLGGASSPFVEQPTVIEALLPHVVGAPVVSISAGYWHAMAVTKSGQTFSWGCNRNAQCGFKPNKDPPTLVSPRPVQFEARRDPHIVKVSAGRSHSAALSENGAVYCWGACQYGQCGILTRRRGGVAPPKLVESLEQVQIVDISAGESHTLALTGGGRVFSWGSGFEGQLGTGSIVQLNAKPKLIGDLDFVAIEAGREWKGQQKLQSSGAPLAPIDPSKSGQDHSLSNVPRIVSVLATGNSSFATSSSGHVYAWGCNDVGNLGVPKPKAGTAPFSEPGLPPNKTSTLREFHTHSFDSSHNVALPLRLDCLSHLNVTSIAGSPGFLWCLGRSRESSVAPELIGRTLYEVQEAKRQKSVRNSRNNRKGELTNESTPAADGSDSNPSTLTTPSSTLDPPGVKDGSQVQLQTIGGPGDPDKASINSKLSSPGETSTPPVQVEGKESTAPNQRNPGSAKPSRRRFSLSKAIGKFVNRATSNSSFRSDPGGGDEQGLKGSKK